MYEWLRNLRYLLIVREAVYKWETNLAKGSVKVRFRGSLSQDATRPKALAKVVSQMGNDEYLVDLKFYGIELS